MMSALLLQAATIVGVAGELPAMRVEGEYLLLRHLVAADAIPADVSRNLRLLRVPDGTRTILLSHEDQAELLRRRLPMRDLRPQAATAMRIEFGRGVGVGRTPPCLATNQSIAAGEWIDARRADPVPCDPERKRARLGYDKKARVPHAIDALPAASYLGPVALPDTLPQPQGRELTWRTRVGPVTIDRSAVLMQPAHAGQRAFVRLSDGSTIAIRLAEGGED